MITLRGRAADKIPVQEALNGCLNVFSEPAIALLYSPREFLFGRLEVDGRLTNSKGNVIDLKNVYEARVFSEQAEFRWLKEAPGKGRAVLISENDISAYLGTDNGLDIDTDELTNRGNVTRTLDQTYLLWGQGVNTQKAPDLAPGWSRLTMARIGRLDVPLASVGLEERVQLHVKEYLNVVDDYGNIAVVEERLIRLAIAERKEQSNG